MSSRIMVFPVMGRRWAFTAVLPTAGAESGGAAAVNNPPVMSLRELVKTLRATLTTSERAEIVTTFASDKMQQQWGALGAAPEGSIRKRLHLVGERMLSRLGPTESFLKAIPKDVGLVEIVYPSCGEVIHRRYMYGSVALIPFSMLFGILPLPNFVLAWNLFRAYSHWRALQGSKRLHYLVTDSSSQVSSSSPQSEEKPVRDGSFSTDTPIGENSGKEDQVERWVFEPSKILETLLVPANVPREPISDETITEICKEFPVDPNEILKWRDHRLQIKSFG